MGAVARSRMRSRNTALGNAGLLRGGAAGGHRIGLSSSQPLGARIHIALRLAQKPDQREMRGHGEIDRQARGRADRGEYGYPRTQRLLDQLEARSAAQYDDLVRERQAAREQQLADELIEGVVPADIFRHTAQAPLEIE